MIIVYASYLVHRNLLTNGLQIKKDTISQFYVNWKPNCCEYSIGKYINPENLPISIAK